MSLRSTAPCIRVTALLRSRESSEVSRSISASASWLSNFVNAIFSSCTLVRSHAAFRGGCHCILTLSANRDQTCFLRTSYSPFFLIVCSKPSMDDRCAELSGSSEVLNRFRGITSPSSNWCLPCIASGAAIFENPAARTANSEDRRERVRWYRTLPHALRAYHAKARWISRL